MKAIALSKKPRIYIPKDFRNEENPPKFKIRSISKIEHLQIQAEEPIKANIFDNLSKLQEAMQRVKDGGEIDNSNSINIDLNALISAQLSTMKTQLKILRLCLLGWENVFAQIGDTVEPLEFNQDNIECLDQEIINELVNEIIGVITQEEQKNSVTPSSSLIG